ncbi:phosphodiesterase [Clostridium aminobutyricum]|uniref:Phosphoesterase n=1 Tax=Clostridium aminobutyricum TaxID=33953 RepID=A0A939IHE0_CLOAM|nr:phosphodiesterase [Clostridium aminobutyricum]MBN7773637.1 phosphodiesterase [Clostridium aminobutyricum]
MKLFFISDIHGSLHFLKKALEHFEHEKADFLVILGDELYHGARNPLPEGYNPKEVALLLNTYAEKIIAVRGNCESEVDQMVLDYPVMADYSIILRQGRRLFLTHGHIFGPDNLPNLSEGDVFLYGHTHIPIAEKRDNIYVINPGSITMPKENNPHTFGILEGDTFIIRDLDNTIVKSIQLL